MLSQRFAGAARRRRSVRRLPRAARDQPVAVHVPPRVPRGDASPAPRPRCWCALERRARSRCGRSPARARAARRRRGGRALEAELRADPKERAEHVMLIDLGRNDVGRVARVGTVQRRRADGRSSATRTSCTCRRTSSGDAAPTAATPLDVLRAGFPAGTLIGRAQDPRHGDHRGARAGAARHLRRRRRLRLATPATSTSRSPSARWSPSGDTIYVQAGAGIVADSDPEPSTRRRVQQGARGAARGRDGARRRREASRDAAPHRQLRLVHLQPRPVPRRARRGGARRAQRRASPSTTIAGARAGAHRDLARARARRTRPASRWT